jgi:glycerophosphoryl diester phosphodiesterase
MSTKPLVWAHRGASGYAPENTLAAFQKAVDLDADGVELDIQLTKDDQIVVIHDETIDRTSDGKGWVKDYTLEELRAFNYNRTKPEYKHADIPTMREVFELLKPTGLFINIEIKTGVVFYEKIEEKILALAKEMGMEDRVCYSSFNHYTVTRIHELKPDAEVGFLYADGPIDMPSYGVKHGVNALHPALYNLQYDGFVKECKEKGLKLNVWTVNERPYMEMCCQYGVDAIITNYPDIAKEVVG